MWIIAGKYNGGQYLAYGDEDGVHLPGWLAEGLQVAVRADGGILDLALPGGSIKVQDPAQMSPADVVTALEVMTTVEQTSGDFPPVGVFPVLGDTHTVN
jgi:hypothetical protein